MPCRLDAVTFPASKYLVNGNLTHVAHSGTTTAFGTAEKAPWFSVDLGAPYLIFHITIYNRVRRAAGASKQCSVV